MLRSQVRILPGVLSLCSSVNRVFVYETKGRKFESCQRRVISLSSMAEQRAVNSKVVGSNPAGGAKSIIDDTNGD